MSEKADQRELRELIERERVVALVDHYLTTLDEPTASTRTGPAPCSPRTCA